jgi:ubiquinone/menaquinone biosynthesis C-methylase UbiE
MIFESRQTGGVRLLDFGCGPGTLSLGLAEIVAPGEVLGIDFSEASIAQAKAQAELLGITNAEFRVSDILDARVPDSSYDVAHFSSVLADQRDPVAAAVGRSGVRCTRRAPRLDYC